MNEYWHVYGDDIDCWWQAVVCVSVLISSWQKVWGLNKFLTERWSLCLQLMLMHISQREVAEREVAEREHRLMEMILAAFYI